MRETAVNRLLSNEFSNLLVKNGLYIDGQKDQLHLIEFLNRHRLLLSYITEMLSILDIPRKLEIKKIAQQETIRNLELVKELNRISRKLCNIDKPLTVLKGPALAVGLYGSLSRRQFTDLDLVVEKDHLSDVILVLENIGYKLLYPYKPLDKNQWKYFLSYNNQVRLRNLSTKTIVELHPGIYQYGLFNHTEGNIFLANQREIMIGAISFNILNNSNCFLYLVYHGVHHLFYRLYWLNDLVEALNKWTLDHKYILETASQLRIGRMLGLSLLLIQEIFGISIPDVYQAYIKDNRLLLSRMKNICMRRIFGEERETFNTKVNRYQLNIMLQPNFNYKWSVIASFYHRWYIRKRFGGH